MDIKVENELEALEEKPCEQIQQTHKINFRPEEEIPMNEQCEESNMVKGENHSKAKTEHSEEENDFVIRVRGLPWSASKEEIVKFFAGSKLKDGANGIHMTMSRGGRPSGNAYVEFETEDDVILGLEKNNKHMGERYIEVFRCKKEEMKRALKRHGMMNEDGASDACVRLRGLPFGCSKEEIAQFFTGMEIVRNGITLPTDFQGRSTGEAYVQFATQEIAEKAMGKHKEKIGHRYIEIFKSSLQEIRSALGMGPVRMRSMGSNRINPYDRADRAGPSSQHGMPRGRSFSGYDNGFRHGSNFGGNMFENMRIPPGPSSPGRSGPMGEFGGSDRLDYPSRGRENFNSGHRVHMRGLPYRAVERDIYDFFRPLKPISVRILYEASGRSSGESDVGFSSHEDAVKAMKKDKEKIQHRYIELFLHSEPKPFRRESGGFNSMDSFGPDNERAFGPRPFEHISGSRRFGPESDRGFGPTTERGFGFSTERSFSSSIERGDRIDRGFSPSGGERPFGPTGERNFAMTSERPFNATERFGGSSERSFNVSGERSFGGTTADRSFGGATTDRSFGASADRSFGTSADRSYAERSLGQSVADGFRNGMSSNNSPFTRSEGRYATGSDMARNEGSDFYSSGKMFGGDSTAYQQTMGRGVNSMIGGSNYSSF